MEWGTGYQKFSKRSNQKWKGGDRGVKSRRREIERKVTRSIIKEIQETEVRQEE